MTDINNERFPTDSATPLKKLNSFESEEDVDTVMPSPKENSRMHGNEEIRFRQDNKKNSSDLNRTYISGPANLRMQSQNFKPQGASNQNGSSLSASSRSYSVDNSYSGFGGNVRDNSKSMKKHSIGMLQSSIAKSQNMKEPSLTETIPPLNYYSIPPKQDILSHTNTDNTEEKTEEKSNEILNSEQRNDSSGHTKETIIRDNVQDEPAFQPFYDNVRQINRDGGNEMKESELQKEGLTEDNTANNIPPRDRFNGLPVTEEERMDEEDLLKLPFSERIKHLPPEDMDYPVDSTFDDPFRYSGTWLHGKLHGDENDTAQRTALAAGAITAGKMLAATSKISQLSSSKKDDKIQIESQNGQEKSEPSSTSKLLKRRSSGSTYSISSSGASTNTLKDIDSQNERQRSRHKECYKAIKAYENRIQSLEHQLAEIKEEIGIIRDRSVSPDRDRDRRAERLQSPVTTGIIPAATSETETTDYFNQNLEDEQFLKNSSTTALPPSSHKEEDNMQFRNLENDDHNEPQADFERNDQSDLKQHEGDHVNMQDVSDHKTANENHILLHDGKKKKSSISKGADIIAVGVATALAATGITKAIKNIMHHGEKTDSIKDNIKQDMESESIGTGGAVTQANDKNVENDQPNANTTAATQAPNSRADVANSVSLENNPILNEKDLKNANNNDITVLIPDNEHQQHRNANKGEASDQNLEKKENINQIDGGKEHVKNAEESHLNETNQDVSEPIISPTHINRLVKIDSNNSITPQVIKHVPSEPFPEDTKRNQLNNTKPGGAFFVPSKQRAVSNKSDDSRRKSHHEIANAAQTGTRLKKWSSTLNMDDEKLNMQKIDYVKRGSIVKGKSAQDKEDSQRTLSKRSISSTRSSQLQGASLSNTKERNVHQNNDSTNSKDLQTFFKKHSKNLEWNENDRSIKTRLKGHPLVFYVPTSFSFQAIKRAGSRPSASKFNDIFEPAADIQLDWVYGYQGKRGRNNIHLLPSSCTSAKTEEAKADSNQLNNPKYECVYHTASIAVILNLRERKQRHYREHSEEIKCLALHPNGIIVGTGQIAGLKSPNASTEKTLQNGKNNNHQKFNDPNLLFKPHVRIWDSTNLSTIAVIYDKTFEKAISCINFSKADDGKYLALSDESSEHNISVWDWQSSSGPIKIAEIKSGNDQILALVFSPLKSGFFYTCGKSHLISWKLNETLLQEWDQGHNGSNGNNGKVSRHAHGKTNGGGNTKLSRRNANFQNHIPKFIICIEFLRDANLLTGDSDGSLLVWNYNDLICINSVINAHSGGIFAILMYRHTQAEEDIIATGGKDRIIKTWNSQTLQLLTKTTQLDDTLGAIRVISPGVNSHSYKRKQSATANSQPDNPKMDIDMKEEQDKALETGSTEKEALILDDNTISGLICEDDSKCNILIGTTKNCILHGNFNDGFNVIIQGHMDSITGLSCNNKSEILTTDAYGQVKLWNSDRKICIFYRELTEGTSCAVFNPIHDEIAAIGTTTGSWIVLDFKEKCIVGQYTTANDMKSSKISAGSEHISCISYSPGGEYIALGSQDFKIYIFTVINAGRSYHNYCILKGHSSRITHLDWSISYSSDLAQYKMGTDEEQLPSSRAQAGNEEETTINNDESQELKTNHDFAYYYIRSNSTDYELLFWDVRAKQQILIHHMMNKRANNNHERSVKSTSQHTDLTSKSFEQPSTTVVNSEFIRDIKWTTQNCVLTFETLGIWNRDIDGGTEITSCAKMNDFNLQQSSALKGNNQADTDISANEMDNNNNNRSILAVGNERSLLRLYPYPSIPIPELNKPKTYHGHTSHITNVQFSPTNQYLLSVGGKDTTILQWKVDR